MIMANITYAEHMYWMRIPCIYRNHVEPDEEKLQNIKLIKNNYVTIDDDTIRHKVNKLSVDIYNYLLEEEE